MTLRPHPVADLFPMMPTEELEALAADIKAHGQVVPISILRGAVIIDGRNRYAACQMAGVEPWTREMLAEFADEDEVVRYIISTNIHRRHLTTEQRAMIASELAKLGRGRPGDNPPIGGLTQGQGGNHGSNASIDAFTQEQAADAMQVSRASVQRAKAITKADPELAAEVKAGKRSLHSAHQEIKRRAQPAPVRPQTDQDQAAADVVDASETLHGEGWTPRARSVLAAMAKLDDVEKTAIRPEAIRILGI